MLRLRHAPHNVRAKDGSCQRTGETTTPWRRVLAVPDPDSIQTISSPSPDPAVPLGVATRVLCVFERKVTSTYNCHPCCWTPARWATNSCTETCFQLGETRATTVPPLTVQVLVATISWTPPWWPQGVPGGIALIEYHDFASNLDRVNAGKLCVAQQFRKPSRIHIRSGFDRNSFTCSRSRPACKGNCP